MIEQLQVAVNGLQNLVATAAYVVAGAITLSVFAKTKAVAPTLATGLVAFLVAWAVQPANLRTLGRLIGQDITTMIPPVHPLLDALSAGPSPLLRAAALAVQLLPAWAPGL